MKAIIDNIEMGKTWTSYISAVDGVLKNAKMYDDEIWKLMGDTGMAFHFIIHKGICASSVTVYNWIEEHQSMIDRIGVQSSIKCIMDYTESKERETEKNTAIRDIKQSIDKGFAVIAWAPTPLLEFGIIHGYDDSDQVFFVKEVTGEEKDPMLYDNIGISDVPILYYQIIEEKIEIDENKIIQDSLKFGINQWRKEKHIDDYYSSGKKGYDYLIDALEMDKLNLTGLAYNIAVYNDSKQCLAKYINYINGIKTFSGKLDLAVKSYHAVSGIFKKTQGKIPFPYKGEGLTTQTKESLIEDMKKCRTLEETAITEIEKLLQQK